MNKTTNTSALRHPAFKWSAKTIVIYTIVSFVYISLSDSLLQRLTTNAHVLSELQTVKAFGFILITAFVMAHVGKRNAEGTEGVYKNLLDTEKERTQAHINRSEQKYWALFNHIPMPMWVFDRESLRFLQVNTAAITKYGYTAEEFSKMTIKDIRPIEDINLLQSALQTSNGKVTCTFPNSFRHICKNGQVIHVKIESTEIIFEGRKARLVVAIDISDEINIQQDLCAANKTLRAACEIANMGYWTNNLQTGEIHWSNELYRIFEVTPATFELSLQNIQAHFHPDYRSQFTDDVASAFIKGEIKEVEHKIITPKGEKWILQRLSLERNENGAPIVLQGISLDITERKKKEHNLQESNTRYQMVMKAAVDAIVDWDLKTNTVQWGAGFKHLFGFDIDNYNNDIWLHHIHPEDKERVITELKKALANRDQDTFYTRFRFLRANAQIAYVKHRAVFVRNVDGRVIRAVGAMLDITQSVLHQQFIERQNKSLREIAWVQSHVVRGPLATLMGLVNLLRDRKQYDIKEDDIIPEIVSTANKLDDVIKVIVNKSETVNSETAA